MKQTKSGVFSTSLFIVARNIHEKTHNSSLELLFACHVIQGLSHVPLLHNKNKPTTLSHKALSIE
jgi:hypothetical protein